VGIFSDNPDKRSNNETKDVPKKWDKADWTVEIKNIHGFSLK
jgi:hypothetical protein